MNIIPIFETWLRREECNLWSICYPEDQNCSETSVDIFDILFSNWNDTEYLYNYFTTNEKDLRDPAWRGLSINDAIDKVLDEAEDFERELKKIEFRASGYKTKSLNDVFTALHTHEYIHKKGFIDQYKGKPNFFMPMLRIYSIKIDTECYVVTGGAIKLTHLMKKGPFDDELQRLVRVQNFLTNERIDCKASLIEY